MSEHQQKDAAQLALNLAMHVVAAKPAFLSEADVPAEALAAERASFEAQAAASGKPAAVAEKMVDGWMRKWLAERCMLLQPYLLDDSLTVAKAVEAVAHAAGVPLRVASFARLEVGEGVEKEATDFASEVAAVASGRG